MKAPPPDDERLSALLDKRLADPQRDELLAHLAADDEDYQVFVDAADILREAEAEDAPGETRAPPGEGTRVIPLPEPGSRSPTHGFPRRIAIAAIVAGLVALSAWGALQLRGRAAEAGRPVQLAARLEHAGQGLPEGWTERRPWTSTRGDGAGPRAVRAAQAGVLLVDLSVAVAAGDSADTGLLATQLWQRFEAQAAPSSPLRRIAARAGDPPEALRPLLVRATERLEGRLGRDHLQLGAWIEAARMAAHGRDEAFFGSGATGRMLDRAEGLAADGSPARGAVSRVRAAIPGQGAPDWAALASALEVLLREVAS